MSAFEQLRGKMENALEGLHTYVAEHPEEGMFHYCYDSRSSQFRIFTNISPERIASLSGAWLCWSPSTVQGRICHLRFVVGNDPINGYCDVEMFRIDYNWPMPE